jgi:deazaflavin-dependent oxidoreductase (nitroreductase family)
MARAAHIKSDWFNTNVVNRLVSGLGITSSLTVRGRKSGKPRTVPVHVLELGDRRYLVAPRGETEWVLNARAAGGEVIVKVKGRKARRFHADQVTGPETHRIIDEYKKRWGKELVDFWGKLPDDDQHPVFELIDA